ncbi:hypothetical protein GCM10023191_048520 [Actinoallomurus oryzae]|uniref:Uncharacterized protein n=1 Tax=Actinoallomurus oryzae TaxID=502180 RepID=A0ABP8QAT8_9ACTN
MAGHEDLRAAAARDKDFVGVDVDAMARLIHQMNGASQAIATWLRTNATLPPSVPRTGLRQAQAVHTWTGSQQGMLTRRRNYAITHLSQGGPTMPKVSAGRLGGGARRRTTSAGAGHDLGGFPDVRAATRAGSADAAAVRTAHEAHRPVPEEVWRRLRASADDPDYAHGLYGRLGPAGTAWLIEAAGRDHLDDVRASLGVASHHLTMDEKWLRAMLDEALRRGVRDDAVALLSQAALAHRTRVAFGHLGLMEMVETGGAETGGSETGGSETGQPAPPHEARLTLTADDPQGEGP